jgi:hypothetical protein
MSPILAGATLAVAAGAVIAASAREARAALIGVALVLGLGPFVAEPLPGPAILGVRVVTGILVAYLLWAVAGAAEVRGLGSRIGWPAEAALGLAAAICGVALAGSLASLQPGLPEPAGQPAFAITTSGLVLGTGLALVAIGLAPAFLARVPLRATIGLLLLAQGIVLARTGIAGAPGDLEQLGVNGLVLAIGAAGALIAAVGHRGAPTGHAPPGPLPPGPVRDRP